MTVKAKTATRVKPAAESMVNDAPRVFDAAGWTVGSAAHQGDVILVRIAGLPAGATPRKNRQVAEGDTQGSRHVLYGGDIYDVPVEAVAAAVKAACPKADVQPRYCGPVYVTDKNTALRHPEHGDHEYAEAGCVVAVVFQRNLDAEMREQRVAD